MTKFFKRATAFLLALSLTALTGCGGGANSDPKVAMGRYVEEQSTAPSDIGAFIVAFYQLPDGAIELLANADQNTGLGPYQLLRSEDGGKSWNKKEAPWLAALGKDILVSAAGSDGNGGFYMFYQVLTQEYMDAVSGDNLDYDNVPTLERVFIHVDSNGNTEKLPYELPKGEYGDEANDLQVAANGDIVLCTGYRFIQIDPASGETKNTYQPEGTMYYDSFLIFENTLAVSSGDNILLYNLENGEQSGTIPCTNNAPASSSEKSYFDGSPSIRRALAMNADNTAIYFADKTGIYRHLLEGSVLEQLASGELTSLNMPSVSPMKMAVSDDEILVLAGANEGTTFFSYRYDETVPSVPSTELKIYSLNENKTIRQAMGLFQRSHPDVHITYKVGISGDAVTVSDALRLLSTELLAGKGPDILVLDGMPIDSYIEKGVLENLEGMVGKHVTAGEWLENISNTFRQSDGKTYAIPARFQVPSILGDQDIIDANAKGLTEFISAIMYNADGGEISSERLLSQAQHPVYTLRTLYPVCSPAWFEEDGSIKETELASFLQNIKTLVGEHGEEWGGMDFPAFSNSDITFGALYWADGAQKASIGSIQSIANLAAPDAAMKQAGKGTLVPLSGQAGRVYEPRTILGINASGSQKELASAFVELTLSKELQVNDFEDGMPVNIAAMEENAQNPYSETDDGMWYGYSYFDDDGVEQMGTLQVIWPEPSFISAQIESYKALTTPSITDTVVLEMVISESWDYFLGNKSLENTVTAISEKMKLYLSE